MRYHILQQQPLTKPARQIELSALSMLSDMADGLGLPPISQMGVILAPGFLALRAMAFSRY